MIRRVTLSEEAAEAVDVRLEELPPQIVWGELFGRVAPIEVDIGCGKGRFRQERNDSVNRWVDLFDPCEVGTHNFTCRDFALLDQTYELLGRLLTELSLIHI